MAKCYLKTIVILLVFTATAKLYSVFGHDHAKVLLMTDPLFGMHFWSLLILAAMLELAVASICVLVNSYLLRAFSVAWLASMFLLYRIGLHTMRWQKPCPCLGNFSDALHISPTTADYAMKIVLAYLLIGSYVILFHQWWKKKMTGRLQNDEVKPESGVGS